MIARAGTTLALVSACVLGGCALPRSGPTNQQIMAETRTEAETGIPSGILRIEASPAAVAAANGAALPPVDAAFLGAGTFAADAVGRGDTLLVTVFENVETPLLGAAGQRAIQLPPLEVDRNGNIFMPYAGTIRAAGRSLDQLRGDIAEAFAAQTPDPQVVVERKPGNAATVTVAGSVAKQGLVPLDPQVNTLTRVIAASGGSLATPEDTVVTLVRGGRQAEFRLDELLRDGRTDIPLRPADRIMLREDKRSIAVFGAAGAQGPLRFSGNSFSLTDALAGAGGLSTSRAYPKGVYVFREQPDSRDPRQTVYHFDFRKVEGAFLANGFLMRDGDILYIAEAPFVNLTRVLDAIRGTANTGVGFADIGK